MNIELHLGKVNRYLWKEQDLLIVLGQFEELFVSKKLYEERYKIQDTSGEEGDLLKRLICAAGLAAVSLAERESWGWTMTMEGQPFGFFCGVEPEGVISVLMRDADEDRNTVYLQRQKEKAPLVESHYQPLTPDPALAVQRYFEQVEQTKTRIALDGNEGILVQALPGGKLDDTSLLMNDELIAKFKGLAKKGELKDVGEVVLFYDCRCNDDMIGDMVTQLPDVQQDELWGDDLEINIECPRCGREFVVKRS